MDSKSTPSIKKNFLYNIAYQVLTIILPVITAPYVSRVLGAENIGLFSFVCANLSYFMLIGVFGLSTYSQFEVARRRDDDSLLNQFCVESLMTRLFTMGLSTAAYIILYLIPGNQYKIYYLVSIFYLLSNALDVTWICQGLENFKIVALRNMIVKVAGVALIFLTVRSKNDLILYILINFLSTFIGNLSLFPYVRKYLSIKNIKRIRIVPHLKAALIYFLPSTASVIITTADKLMIGWFSIDMIQNGYYEQAMKIENIIFMLFAALSITMRPRMAYLYKNREFEAINQYMRKSLSIVTFLAFPIVAGLIQISDIFVPWFFGDGYDGVAALLKVMSFWILIKSVSNCLIEQSIVPKGGMLTATKIVWCAAILNIILNYLLIPIYSGIGAAMASLTTEVCILLMTLVHVQKEMDVLAVFPKFWKSALSAGAMFVFIGGVKKVLGGGLLNTVIISLAGGIFYLCVEVVLKDAVPTEFLQTLKGKLRGYIK